MYTYVEHTFKSGNTIKVGIPSYNSLLKEFDLDPDKVQEVVQKGILAKWEHNPTREDMDELYEELWPKQITSKIPVLTWLYSNRNQVIVVFLCGICGIPIEPKRGNIMGEIGDFNRGYCIEHSSWHKGLWARLDHIIKQDQRGDFDKWIDGEMPLSKVRS